jgi:methylthioribose-1-phosphate isomerase
VVLAGASGDPVKTLKAAEYIKSARPTAVNLFWAIARMKKIINDKKNLFEQLLKEAQAIEWEDKNACQRIGEFGAKLISDNAKIIVHCNAGALATSGIGTALGVLHTAKNDGKDFTVYACETRPLLQGARLTSWELSTNNIETYAICDNMAATYMPEMNLVLVGADRIATNGDTANKIGTRGLAIIAQYYNIPFYVAAPTSSFDSGIMSGRDIPIEFRAEDEIRRFNGKTIVARGAKIRNPAFDVTPASLISGIITEGGIVMPPYQENIAGLIDNIKVQ